MNTQERIQKKIALYIELSCHGHYKTRDGRFGVEKIYDGWSDKVKYYPFHNGYLDDWEHTKTFSTEVEAEEALDIFLDDCIIEHFKWHEKPENRTDTGELWLEISHLSLEQLDEMKGEWERLNETDT